MKQEHMSLEQVLEHAKTLTKDQQEVFEMAFVAGMQKQAQSSVDRAVNNIKDNYTAGWNAALEIAAAKTDEFKPAFGDDTCASWAVWLRRMKQ